MNPNQEEIQPHTQAENWIKVLLSKVLPTSPTHQETYTSLLAFSIRGQRKQEAQWQSAKTKTILQKVNHVEKAESCVPGEETR